MRLQHDGGVWEGDRAGCAPGGPEGLPSMGGRWQAGMRFRVITGGRGKARAGPERVDEVV